jgi:soluble lytic murein transglycosylase
MMRSPMRTGPNGRRWLARALCAGMLVGAAGLVPAWGAEEDGATMEPAATAPTMLANASVANADTVTAAALSAPPPLAITGPDLRGAAAEISPALLRDAMLAYRRGDVSGGDRLRARVTDPVAIPLLDWAAIRFGGQLVDFDRLAAFTRANPDWPGAGWLRRRAEELLVAERKPAPVLRAFFARERPVTAQGKLALALAFQADGLEADAAALIRDAWRNDIFGRELEARMLAEFPAALTQADHRFRMERLLFKENWDGARRAADYAGKDFGALVKARVAVNAKAANAAKVLDAVPAALRADTSYLFSRAQFLRRAEKAGEAAKLIADVTPDPAILGDGDEWWVERRLIARKLLDDGDPKAAYTVCAAHGANANERRIEAEFHCGWIALRFLNEPDTAARHFARAGAIAATPISLARVAYWQGRAAEAAKAGDEATIFYRRAATQATTYYGQLAAAKLGRPVSLRPSPDPTSRERLAAERLPVVRAMGLLYAAGLRDIALPLIIDLGKQDQNIAELDAIGDIAEANRDARALLALGKAATQRGLPLDEQAYPVVGIPAYETAGAGVEKAMVYAIARQESAFDPTAASGVGAKGLMQLMPATAQNTAKKIGVEFDAGRLGEASYNARLGAAHLGELMDNWKGSHILTFASYNAGPGNARKWIDAYGDPRSPNVDPVDWVERIPFSETRNYVQRVLENLVVYRKRLEQRSAGLTPADMQDGARP